jgi:uncharacterized membrane protein
MDPALPRPAPAVRPPAGFFVARWRGQVPLWLLFWRDMVLIGTTINVLAAVAAVIMARQDMPQAAVVLVFLSPLPWNLFLVVAVWRSSAASREPWVSAARLAALCWLAVVTVI